MNRISVLIPIHNGDSSYASGNESESSGEDVKNCRHVPRGWEWLDIEKAYHSSQTVYPTRVGVTRSIRCICSPSFCLSHAGGSDTFRNVPKSSTMSFVPREWEWIGMVYYMKESCRLSYMRGNEPDEGDDYIKDYKAYPTYVGMTRNFVHAGQMVWSLSHARGSDSKIAAMVIFLCYHFPMYVGVFRKLRRSIPSPLWGNDSPFAST